jgi:hypothetical protein
MNSGSGICDKMIRVLRAASVERKTVSAFNLDKGLSSRGFICLRALIISRSFTAHP